MAFNSQIKGYMTFGKSFSRGGAFPLEAYEIWTDYDALVAYAANTDPAKDPSYIGQKVAYVDLENNKVTHYGIEIDGTLKELGASPIGDEKSIVIGENNTISLKGIDGLVFERDIIGEDGQPTGQKENVQFQPLMTKDGLIWVEPSKTTVEGLASLIDGLTARVSALENDRVTEQELADAVKVEADRAKAAEEALGKRIDEIDFVDNNELASAINSVEAKIPTNNNQLENGAGYQTADDVSNAIADKADKATTLVGYGITDAYTKTEVDTELNTKVAQDDFSALKARVEAFLDNTGAATDAIDTLQELITYIDTHDDIELTDIIADIEALQKKVILGTDAEGKEYTTVKAYVEAAIEALKIGDYAKAADLTTLAGRVKTLEEKPFDDYATKSEVEAVDGKFKDVVAKSDFETFQTENAQAIAAARSGAVSDVEAKGYAVASDVANTYATKQFVGEIPTDAEATTIIGYINEKAQEVLDSATGGSSESAASVKQQLDTYKSANDPKVNALLAEVYGALAEGETEYNYTADSRIDALEKADVAQDALIASNTTLAQQGVDAAAAAKGIADQNKIDLGTLQTNFDNIVTKADTGLVAKVSALESKDTELAGLITGLDSTVKSHTSAIAEHGTKLTALENKDTELATLIKGNTDKFADYSTTTQMNAAIEAAITGADLGTYAKKVDLEAIYKAGDGEAAATGILAVEIERAKAAEKANADAIAVLNGYVDADNVGDTGKSVRTIVAEETAKIVNENNNGSIDTLNEIAAWIINDTTGAAHMANDIAALKGAVDTGDLKVSEYVAAQIAAIPATPVATTEVAGIVKASDDVNVAADGKMTVARVSTDALVQGTDTLVLNGGNAITAAAE